jgi:hypothetical protein
MHSVAVVPGPRKARNPESRCKLGICLWILGSLAYASAPE